MNFEEKIGLRIRNIREQQGLSREELCGDESQLTVRQLLRIELNQSIPTLPKLKHITRVLNIKMSDLLDNNAIIPEDYYQLKYQLINTPHYKDKQRLKEKYDLLDKIYDKYMNILTEEELIILDLIEKRLEIASNMEVAPISEQYEEELHQIIHKKSLSMLDLQILDFYFTYIQDHPIDVLYEDLVNKVFQQQLFGDDEYNGRLLNILLCIAGVGVCHQDYKYMKDVVIRANEIIDETRMFNTKPGIAIIEAKHYLYVEKNNEKAIQSYDEAEQLAKMFGDQLFIENLRRERQQDGL